MVGTRLGPSGKFPESVRIFTKADLAGPLRPALGDRHDPGPCPVSRSGWADPTTYPSSGGAPPNEVARDRHRREHAGSGRRVDEIETTGTYPIPTDPLERVIGQEKAVEIARIAAFQRRHLLLVGPPGIGKSMTAQALALHLERPRTRAAGRPQPGEPGAADHRGRHSGGGLPRARSAPARSRGS